MKLDLPVSFGEAFDKQTILEIKINSIRDEEGYIQRELNFISEIISPNNKKTIIFYKFMLSSINKKIWSLQDEFRVTKSQKLLVDLCIEITKLNDARFRVKKKIDNFLNSDFKEQKGYDKKKLFFLSHLGLGDHITSIGMIRYYSCFYDEIVVVCKSKNFKNLQDFYSDDPTIKFYQVEDDRQISTNFGFSNKRFSEITDGYDVIKLGLHNTKFGFRKKRKIGYQLPFSFYNEVSIPPEVAIDFFYMPEKKGSNLNKDIPYMQKYCLIHSETSQGVVFDRQVLTSRLGISDDVLLIDINKNLYNKSEKFFKMAEKFINKSFLEINSLITSADYIAVTDSSLFCLSVLQKTQAKEFYCFSTSNWDHLNTIRSKCLTSQSNFVPIVSCNNGLINKR